MPDIPGDSSTTSTISVGGTVTNELESVGDHDWFRITLTAGQSVTVTLNGLSSGTGLTLEDPYLYIRGASGNLLFEDDDIQDGVNRDSSVSFTATTGGTYYIDVGAWNEGYTGTYKLSVTTYTPPPLWTNDQIAYQLTTGFWGDGSHGFTLTGSRSISVNLSGLTPEGANLARTALAAWSEIIGVTFPEVLTGGQIIFDDSSSGANTRSDYDPNTGAITASYVNIETQWLTDYGSTVGTYGYQTYLHEIGHALGLGHAGNYNGDARYPFEASFQNDSWAASVMSYFSQKENTYTRGQGFTEAYLVTPMVADIIAIQQLYGAGSARSGDTSYGVGGTGIYVTTNFSSGLNGKALTIYDTGGIDTIDFSTMANGQKIDLNAETFSSVGTGTGNLSIARGTVIENATGGSGWDQIMGNSVANVLRGNAGNDTLTGGAGNDTFIGTRAQMNGDTVTDFSAGDKLVFTDATSGSFTFSLSGNTLTFTGGSMTLANVSGSLVASAAAGGGVQLALAQAAIADVRNDFNGDGRSDILWRDGSGTLSEWLGQADGSFAWNPSSNYSIPASWTLVATGDFNNDTRDDILWRDGSGTLSEWLGQANGSFAWNSNATYAVPASTTLVATGDFNNDGRDDVLWRDSGGTLSEWLGQANGSFAWNPASNYSIPTSWTLVGTGDFNNDGRDDILWRDNAGVFSEWLGQSNGSFAWNPNATYQIPTSWTFEDTGDFNGDGRDDVLWRDGNGTLSEWLGQANGSFAWNPVSNYQVSPSWTLETTGDFNKDGRDDIIWRDGNGTLSEWLGQADGSFAWNPGVTYHTPTSWHMQPDLL